MKFRLDTNCISILQKQSGAEFAALIGRIAQVPRANPAICIGSFLLAMRCYASLPLAPELHRSHQ